MYDALFCESALVSPKPSHTTLSPLAIYTHWHARATQRCNFKPHTKKSYRGKPLHNPPQITMSTTAISLPSNATTAEIIAALNALQSSVSAAEATTIESVNEFYSLWAGVLVLSMQIGFAMLEAGSVHSKNVINIFFKNIMDASISVLAFWLLGYGGFYM